jgi:hypothetical protein
MFFPLNHVWWQDNAGGRQIELRFGETDRTFDVLQLSEPDQRAEPLPFALSTAITFGAVDITSNSRVLLDLAWGNPRAELRATIDAVGQVVNLAGNYLRVSARTIGAVGASGTAVLAVNVTRVLCRERSLPRFTDRMIPAVAAGATVGPFLVPAFARRVVIATSWDQTGAANTLLVQWFTRQPAAAIFTQAQVASPLGWTTVDVPPGAGSMFLTNGPVVTNVQPIWELAL